MLYIFIPIIRNKFNKKIPLLEFHAPIFNSMRKFQISICEYSLASLS